MRYLLVMLLLWSTAGAGDIDYTIITPVDCIDSTWVGDIALTDYIVIGPRVEVTIFHVDTIGYTVWEGDSTKHLLIDTVVITTFTIPESQIQGREKWQIKAKQVPAYNDPWGWEFDWGAGSVNDSVWLHDDTLNYLMEDIQ